jgi:hypothetical protein
MKTDKELMILGLDSRRGELISNAKNNAFIIAGVANPLEYVSTLSALSRDLDEYLEIEKRLNELNPERNNIPF